MQIKDTGHAIESTCTDGRLKGVDEGGKRPLRVMNILQSDHKKYHFKPDLKRNNRSRRRVMVLVDCCTSENHKN